MMVRTEENHRWLTAENPLLIGVPADLLYLLSFWCKWSRCGHAMGYPILYLDDELAKERHLHTHSSSSTCSCSLLVQKSGKRMCSNSDEGCRYSPLLAFLVVYLVNPYEVGWQTYQSIKCLSERDRCALILINIL